SGELLGGEVLEHAFGPAFHLVRIRAGGAEDRPTARQEARDLARTERLEGAVDEAAPPGTDADDVVPAKLRAPRNGPDDRVQPRAVASAGEDPDSHERVCRRWESNPHGTCAPPDFESGASTSSATSPA